jgi:hypothetical protein
MADAGRFQYVGARVGVLVAMALKGSADPDETAAPAMRPSGR